MSVGRVVARVVTINLWGDREPLGERLDAVAAGLAELAPDVVLAQEVRRGEGLPLTADALAERLGPSWRAAFGVATTAPAGTWGPGSGAGEEGLAVLSPHPLAHVQSTELPEVRPHDRRILLSARVEVRGTPLSVHTTHLHWRLGDGLAREQQVLAVDAAARAYQPEAAGASVHVVGGDFNAAPETDEIRFMVGWHTLAGRRALWQDAFAQAHPAVPGWTWARRNPSTDWLAHVQRDRRIDYLFVSPEQRGGMGRVESARVILDTPDARGVWPSDHFGVLAEIVIG